MTIIGIRAAGEDLTYDLEAEFTAADLWAIDELGMRPSEFEGFFTRARAMANVEASDTATLELGLRALCAIAFLAHRRAGHDTPWKDYARTLKISEIEVHRVEQAPANRAERRAATRTAGKRNRKTPARGEVAAALVDADAAAPTD